MRLILPAPCVPRFGFLETPPPGHCRGKTDAGEGEVTHSRSFVAGLIFPRTYVATSERLFCGYYTKKTAAFGPAWVARLIVECHPTIRFLCYNKRDGRTIQVFAGDRGKHQADGGRDGTLNAPEGDWKTMKKTCVLALIAADESSTELAVNGGFDDFRKEGCL